MREVIVRKLWKQPKFLGSLFNFIKVGCEISLLFILQEGGT